MTIQQVIAKLALGDVEEALRLSEPLPDVHTKIKESIEFLKHPESYKDYYQTDFDGIEKRIPGLFADGEPDLRQKFIISHVSAAPKHDSLLDVGCADGSLVFYLIRRGVIKSAHGVDLWKNGIKFANANALKKGYHASFTQAMFEEFEIDFKFDVITFGEILEHVIDPIVLLKKAQTLLAEDGRIVATVPVARPPVTEAEVQVLLSGKPNQHVRHFTEDKFLNLAAEAGLVPTKSELDGQSWTNFIVTLKRK